MPTERRGPFTIERGIGHSVAVQSSVAYGAVLVMPLKVRRVGRMNVVEPFALERGMSLILSAAEHDDVVIDGGNGGSAA